MSEYGNGVSMQQAFAYDKERIKKAFQGLIWSGKNEKGEFLYRGGTKEEAEKYILEAFDNAVYWALKLNASAKTQEEMLNHYRESGHVPDSNDMFADYLVLSEEQEKKMFNEEVYKFEDNEYKEF